MELQHKLPWIAESRKSEVIVNVDLRGATWTSCLDCFSCLESGLLQVALGVYDAHVGVVIHSAVHLFASAFAADAAESFVP